MIYLVELLLDAKNVDLCIMSTIKIITRIALLLFLSLLIYQGLSESQSWLSQSIWFAFLGYILIDIVADFSPRIQLFQTQESKGYNSRLLLYCH